jgi:hypothetical protein
VGASVTNLNEFNKEINAFAVTVPKRALVLQKKMALDLLSKIIFRTPVGNPSLWQNPAGAPAGYVGGRARANWQVSLGTPGGGEVRGEDATGGTTLAAGVSKMASAKPGGVIWLYNNLPYIVRLEFGWSKQAPNGMVRLSLAEINAAYGTVE